MNVMQRMRRFARATGGMAAVEFALLLPMMILLLFGSIDLVNMLGANRRAQNAAASLADVVSRDTEISNAEVSGLWAALDVLLYPNTAQQMQVRISSVRIVDASTARVVWSEGHGGYAPRTADSIIALPAGMMQPGASVIVSETIYSYQAPVGIIQAAPMSFRHTAYRRSRIVDPIPRVA